MSKPVVPEPLLQLRGSACCLLAKSNGVPLKALAKGIVAIAMEQDLKPFTDELPRDVVPLDAVHPRNLERYSKVLLHRFGASGWLGYADIILGCATLVWCYSGVLYSLFYSSFPWAESGALLGALGLGYVVRLHRAPVPWTGTFGRFRVQRGGDRLIMVDPLWPRRWGPTFETLRLFHASKSLLRPEFHDAEEEMFQAPAGYRDNAPGTGAHGEPVHIRPSPTSRGAVSALCVAVAILTVALVFVLAPLQLFVIRTPLLCFAVALGVFAFTSGNASGSSGERYSIEDGCLCRHGSRPLQFPLERIIAIEVVGEELRFWLREGNDCPSKYKVCGSGVDIVKALLAESAFMEGAPLQFNDPFSKTFAVFEDYRSMFG